MKGRREIYMPAPRHQVGMSYLLERSSDRPVFPAPYCTKPSRPCRTPALDGCPASAFVVGFAVAVGEIEPWAISRFAAAPNRFDFIVDPAQLWRAFRPHRIAVAPARAHSMAKRTAQPLLRCAGDQDELARASKRPGQAARSSWVIDMNYSECLPQAGGLLRRPRQRSQGVIQVRPAENFPCRPRSPAVPIQNALCQASQAPTWWRQRRAAPVGARARGLCRSRNSGPHARASFRIR